jgi:[ribosomal protein S18]-alanine N-acetyltransferase
VAAAAQTAQTAVAVSAVAIDAEPDPALRAMREADLDAILAIEQRAYPFPWTRGIFRDCLAAAYPAWVLHEHGLTIGYGVISLAADEAHLLNLCIAPERQGRGYGRQLLRALVKLAADRGAARIFLEVRPSNPNAIALYHDEGFNEIGRRPRYYPAKEGREDAIVMAMELLGGEIEKMPAL